MSSINPFNIARILQTVYAKHERDDAPITQEDITFAEELKGKKVRCFFNLLHSSITDGIS